MSGEIRPGTLLVFLAAEAPREAHVAGPGEDELQMWRAAGRPHRPLFDSSPTPDSRLPTPDSRLAESRVSHSHM